MKKVILFSIAIFLLLSCTTTIPGITVSNYESSIENINNQITDINDYTLRGIFGNTTNDLVVTGSVYNRYGYSSSLANSILHHSSYVFTNSEGNNISFGVSRRIGYDMNSNIYIYDIAVSQCSCDEKDLYQVICGPMGIVKSIVNIEKDGTYTFYDVSKTYGAYLGSSLAVSLLIYLIAMGNANSY